MLAIHTHLRHAETVIAVDVQTLASIATMIATGVAVVTFLSKSTNRRLDDLGDRIDHAREEAKADNTLLRTEVHETRADVRALSERMFTYLTFSPQGRPQAQGE